MKPETTSDLQRQLAARIQFYRELGIYDFYRRDVQESGPQRLKPAMSAAPDGAVETAPFRNNQFGQQKWRANAPNLGGRATDHPSDGDCYMRRPRRVELAEEFRL